MKLKSSIKKIVMGIKRILKAYKMKFTRANTKFEIMIMSKFIITLLNL